MNRCEINIEKPENLVAIYTVTKYSNSVDHLFGHGIKINLLLSCLLQYVLRESALSYPLLYRDGRVSNKHLTINSSFLNLLLSRSIVVADGGFDFEEDVARMQAFLYRYYV